MTDQKDAYPYLEIPYVLHQLFLYVREKGLLIFCATFTQGFDLQIF